MTASGAASLCPHPEKFRYMTRYDAEVRIARYWRERAVPPRLAAYECRCGRWHLTSHASPGAEVPSA